MYQQGATYLCTPVCLAASQRLYHFAFYLINFGIPQKSTISTFAVKLSVSAILTPRWTATVLYLITFKVKTLCDKGNRRRSIGYCPHLWKSPLQAFQPRQENIKICMYVQNIPHFNFSFWECMDILRLPFPRKLTAQLSSLTHGHISSPRLPVSWKLYSWTLFPIS